MHYISSVSNDQVKHMVNLQHKSYRQEHGQFVIEGTRACSQLLKKYKPIKLYMTEEYYKDHTFADYEDSIVGVSNHVMEKISSSKNPSGICAIFAIPEEQPLPTHGPGIILVDVNDPGNMGTLIRTAAAMNINQIIIIGGVDPYNPKVIQSTAGCLATINLYQTTWDKVIAQQLLLCALVVRQGITPDTIILKHNFLVVGNEAHGLSETILKDCVQAMTIPMPGHAESLNAAIAGSIGLYLMSLQN